MIDHRAAASAKLLEGASASVPAAVRHAREYLQAIGASAPVVAYLLLHPDAAVGAKGVREVRAISDADVPSTARLTDGLEQYVHWAAPYKPPSLRVLALQRAAAIAPNVIVTGDGKLLDDNIGFTNAELCNHMPADFNGIAAGGGRILVAARHRDTVRVGEPVIYLPAPGNYAAWLFGALPRLAAFEAEGNVPILLHGDVAPYHLDALRLMGIDEARLRVHGAHVRVECKEMLYCTTSYLHHAHSPRGIRHVRERVKVTPHEIKRLYLARRHAHDRPLLNEADVIALLERHGFTAIDPEKYSVEEQARHAAGAEIVVGPYGANLANLVFTGNATRLLIIGAKRQPEFARLASVLGIAFWHVIPQAIKIREGRTFSESHGFQADLVQLEHALAALLDMR